MNINGIIHEQIDWDGTAKRFQFRAKESMGELWVGFPSEWVAERDGPFYFLDEEYAKIFENKKSTCQQVQIADKNFYQDGEIFFFKTTWRRINTQSGALTYYALYLPEFAIPTRIKVLNVEYSKKEFSKNVFKDDDKNRYIVYVQCTSRHGKFNFNIDCQFYYDKEGFQESIYKDDRTVDFYAPADMWKWMISEDEIQKVEAIFNQGGSKNINDYKPTLNRMSRNIKYEHGYALLIGIRYGFSKKPLEGTLKDVNALYSHFTDDDKAGYKSGNIILLTEEKATRDGIERALMELASKVNSDPEATVIIYYSGHGGTDGTKYFLAPYDYNLGHLLYSKTFAEKIAAIQAKKSLVILDCCHAENIPIEKQANISSDFLKGFIEEVNPVLEGSPIEKSVGNSIKKGSGRVILTSCEAGETSLDVGSNGLFTQVLLECLNGKHNIEKDGWVRLVDMIRYIPSSVAERAKSLGHDQHPMFKRIENLSSEEYIVCAYNILQAKGQNGEKNNKNSDIAEIMTLIDNNDFVNAFNILDKIDQANKFQYNRLKREFSAGLKGMELIDFADRLKVFVTHIR